MGDVDAGQHKQGSSGRAKIVIRKCKKESSEEVKSSITSFKKINGELFLNENEKEIEDNADTNEANTSKTRSKGSRTITIRSVKRKRPHNTNQTPGHEILEDEIKIVDKKVNEGDFKYESSSPIEFKGFKKRILAQSEKMQDLVSDETEESAGTSEQLFTHEKKTEPEVERPATDSTGDPEHTSTKPKIIKLIKGKRKVDGNIDDGQGESQAEYAQYLGLQPTMQFKCYRCGEKGFPSLLALNVHQRSCGVMRKSNFIANIQQDQMSPSDPNMLTNFRITRKVYLCSACGTYYENWNLFLHMRDVHKKHICLLCLAMFGVADKLAEHLKVTHNIKESTFISSDEFQTMYKGSFYLICCVCENMFNERDNFFGHDCVKKDPAAKCTICGVKCGHYYTCPNSNAPRTLAGNVPASSTLTVSTPGTLVKYSGTSSKKNTEQMWTGKKGPGKIPVDNDDDYDVSHAASFCHVDIGDESADKGKKGTEDDLIDITRDDSPANAPSEIFKTVLDHEQTELTSSTSNKDVHAGLLGNESEVLDISLPNENEGGNLDRNLENINEAEEIRNIVISDITKSDGSETSLTNKESRIMSLNTDEMNVEKPSEHEINMNIENADASKEAYETAECAILNDKSISAIEPEPYATPTVNDKQHLNVEDLGSSGSGKSIAHENDSKEGGSSLAKREYTKEIIGGTSSSSPKENSSCETDSDRSGLVVDENPKRQKPARQKSKNMKIKRKEAVSSKIETQLEKQHSSNEDTFDMHLNNDSDDNQNEGEKENVSNNVGSENSDYAGEINDGIVLAKEDTPAMALTLEDKLQNASPQSVVKECVRTSCLNCVYCSHAVKIAVNGKQLALHLLAEHRYKPVKNNETIEDVVNKLKKTLDSLDSVFFNTESYDSSDKSLNMSYDHTYECFQCQFTTKSHKELYVHKRKMHQKTVLLCVMCKSTFYSYSELLCHLCPGDNVSEDIYFRCCFCNLDMIPSAFRLMVHLRKGHHTCDICLEDAGDQSKLSTHMWKHKLNHLCYRCGIAYRNKPDITKHLFWKHGTESVVCKKCLQKKWPHVYHFCIPPTVFICEECNASFTRAVALKVHKRLHVGELPYKCSQCGNKFVSKKLLSKHEDAHNHSILDEASNNSHINTQGDFNEEHINVESLDDADGNKLKDKDQETEFKDNDATPDALPESKLKKKKKKDKKNKTVVDVYDLPPLNLSSESDSSDGETKQPISKVVSDSIQVDDIVSECNDKKHELFDYKTSNTTSENIEPQEENQTPTPIVDGVWDNFHSYKAELEKRDLKDLSLPNILPLTSDVKVQSESAELVKTIPEEAPPDHIMLDHCYCLIPGKPRSSQVDGDEPELAESMAPDKTTVKSSAGTVNKISDETPAPRGHSSSIDHPYATLNTSGEGVVSAPSNGAAAPSELPSTQESTSETCPDSQGGSQPIDKKKQKTPKKKKETLNSSSSSDSSSDSDSSCCSNCKSNCSCSTNSSSNSSSSSSSDSDSSTPEGKQRAAERKEKKKERIKHKHSKEGNLVKSDNSLLPAPVTQEEEAVENIPKAPVEPPIRESDLDTDESSTDEDFYDRYPQSHAKQQIEKNKLMLLASVAPVNNGSVSPLQAASEENNPPTSLGKKKIKTKKRKKSLTLKKTSKKGSGPQSQSQPSTSSVTIPFATSTQFLLTSNSQHLVRKTSSPLPPMSNFHSDTCGGSGSENESSRLSKRKRVRNKFYGYSSEEEYQERPSAKWRKEDTSTVSRVVNPVHSYQPLSKLETPTSGPQGKMLQKPSESSGTDDESPVKKAQFTNSSSSSSSSSDSDNEIDTKPVVQNEQTEKSDNLYCYCQCPYDEVSEMIACDGQDCTIEWFHFECVGIMVPPKGKWFCPDCRKRRDLM